jgi:hypothetical protein
MSVFGSKIGDAVCVLLPAALGFGTALGYAFGKALAVGTTDEVSDDDAD